MIPSYDDIEEGRRSVSQDPDSGRTQELFEKPRENKKRASRRKSVRVSALAADIIRGKKGKSLSPKRVSRRKSLFDFGGGLVPNRRASSGEDFATVGRGDIRSRSRSTPVKYYTKDNEDEEEWEGGGT